MFIAVSVAGIQAVPHGEVEAARAMGMSGALTLRRVVLPLLICGDIFAVGAFRKHANRNPHATMRDKPLTVYAIEETLDTLKKHIFNWSVWPDFTAIPIADLEWPMRGPPFLPARFRFKARCWEPVNDAAT